MTIPCIKRIFAAFLFFYASVMPLYAVETPPGWVPSLDEAMKKSKRESKPILLDIYAPWCSFCEKLHDLVYPSPEFKNAAVNYITASIDGEKNPAIMNKYEISGTPVILFLDQNGYELYRVSGYVDKMYLSKVMKSVLSQAELESKLLAELEKKPDGVMENYKAGVYYSDAGDHAKARTYFIRAWNSYEKEPMIKKMDSLYNAAVSSMELKEYPVAISQWNAYINVKKEKDEDYAYARFYRGISYKFTGNKENAKEDLIYARDHLSDLTYKRSAIKLIEGLK